jgi:NADH:ubiquinone oxidoreductase subunit H
LTGVALAVVWLVMLGLALASAARVERASRLAPLRDRPDWDPPRAAWGLDRQPPPGAYAPVRVLAGLARLVRARSQVASRSARLAGFGRAVGCVALASALALVPFAGTWGGRADGRALVCVDLRYGLIVLVFLVFVASMAQVAVGLADRQIWSRLASVALASRSLSGLGLLLIVVAPLALDSGSLRLQDLVVAQQRSFAPLHWLPAPPDAPLLDVLRAMRWPAWHVFTQPLTALLFVPALGGFLQRPWLMDPTTGLGRSRGFGVDDDPNALYWGRFEARLARILGAALFVSLFLGAGAIPFLPTSLVVDGLEPLLGFTLPALFGVVLQVVVYLGKLILILMLLAFGRRALAVPRDDQWIRGVSLRLLPLAWANLLLMSALMLLSRSLSGGLE